MSAFALTWSGGARAAEPEAGAAQVPAPRPAPGDEPEPVAETEPEEPERVETTPETKSAASLEKAPDLIAPLGSRPSDKTASASGITVPAQPLHSTSSISSGRYGLEPPETSWGGVPIIGGNSDYGWGGGALLSVSRARPDADGLFLWRAEMAGVAMFDLQTGKPGFQDYYLDTTVAESLGRGLRFRLRPSYTQISSINYYGVGNAAPRGLPGGPDPNGEQQDFYHYERAEMMLRAMFSHDFSAHVRLNAGIQTSFVKMTVPEDSLLAIQAREGTPEQRRLLSGVRDHFIHAFVWGLEFDTRDDEVNPSSGTFSNANFTFAPGGTGDFAETWFRSSIAARGYVDLYRKRLVLAGRLVSETLFGTPPIYELSRFDNFSNAFGGEKGVRGIEAQRYYGKVKLLGNVELRERLFDFHLIGKNAILLTQFFDFGRLWADFDASEELDGTDIGLKYSVGAGLRMLFEKAFIVALDFAWSPDAQPLGVYLTSGHAF